VHVDFLTLACLRDRLDGLLGARVQRALLVDERSVGLELYARHRHQLLVSAHPGSERMLLVPDRLRRGVLAEPPLLALLRKWVRGARLIDVTQPPWERILNLHFDGATGPCQLVIELIGRYSNVIVVGPDGCVLDAIRRVGPALNRYRVVLPGQPYQLPPVPPDRLPPIGHASGTWAALLADAEPEEPLERLLPRRVLAVSPTVAREIAARASGGDPDAPVQACPAAAVAAATAELFSPLEQGCWRPSVAIDPTGAVVAFAPYELRQFERNRSVRSISVAMWQYFRSRIPSDPYAAARRRVAARIGETRTRIERALDRLQANIADASEIGAMREAGELLLAYQSRVALDAQEVELPDYQGNLRRIALDPSATPVENAQAYFRRYRKSLRASQEIPERITSLEADLAYLEQLATDLAGAESRPEIDAVSEALAEAGWSSSAGRSSAQQIEGPRCLEIDGFVIYAGRNARQNEEVTFERAGPDDLWLHARGLPGAHVVIRGSGRPVPESVVWTAARLAAHHSAARGEKQVPVDLTKRRFVHRVRGGHPGLVSYRNERTLWVEQESRSGPSAMEQDHSRDPARLRNTPRS
jgi:predicted ribosome quality control (RQC) complex YloA/Tae2 family protein